MYVLELIDMNGKSVYSEIHSDSEISSSIGIDVTKYSKGQYLLRVVFGNKSSVQKIVVE